MTNEQIVDKIRNGYSVTDNMQLLYEKNRPLIRKIIKPYTACECEEDLMQEAYFGLWEAVNHYESSENVLFMSYAGYWIKQSVQRYIENCGSVVKIPSEKRQKIIRYNKTVQKLAQNLGRMPEEKEIADSMRISVSEVERLKMYSQGVASLDAPLNNDTEITLGDSIQADFSLENNSIDKIYEEHSKNELWGIVERRTSDFENKIIREYFAHGKTMAAISKEYDISVSRVREIKESGLRRLRIGKAKRELLEKFEFVQAGEYRNSVKKYREHAFTSTVEYMAMRRAEISAEYERRIQECLRYTPQKSS